MSKLTKILKYQLWRIVRKLNLDVYPIDRRNSVQAYLSHIFLNEAIDCVWDLGANTGQYASMLRNIGFKGEIISFEPIPVAWENLRRNASSDKRWIVHDRCAIGLIEGEAQMNVTADSVSSSLLRPLDVMAVVETVGVRVKRLDSIIERVKPSLCSLLKIDCQGSEHDIILSAENEIRRFLYVQLEASLYPLYEGEKTFFELSELMLSYGFDIAFIFPGITDTYDRMVQVELIFKRR